MGSKRKPADRTWIRGRRFCLDPGLGGSVRGQSIVKRKINDTWRVRNKGGEEPRQTFINVGIKGGRGKQGEKRACPRKDVMTFKLCWEQEGRGQSAVDRRWELTWKGAHTRETESPGTSD